MKKVLSVNFRLNRPKGYLGKGDKYLTKIIQELSSFLRKTQRSFKYDTLRLPGGKIRDLAHVLVEFAEDVYNDIGIWKSLEQYNFEFFGTELPLTLQPGEEVGSGPINKSRIKHLLWVQYHMIELEFILSPNHQDLNLLAEVISDFLDKRFEQMPLGSSVKTFLAQPDDYGWDVKRKLIWLGKHSYLFRQSYYDYVAASEGGKPEIEIVDDFVCQNTTFWSGLGVIDILASLLEITAKQQSDIRSWYERHAAFYKVLSVNGPLVKMLNIINEKPYTVRVGEYSSQFDKKHIYFGSLAPWDGEWYWSGKQHRYDNVSDEDAQELKKSFLSKMKTIPYRYDDDLADKARESIKDQYKYFVEYHGKDLVVYPDGHSMVSDMQKQYLFERESKLRDSELNSMDIQKYEMPDLTKSFPPELLASDSGVCVYFNPDEGQEIMQEFYDVINGFKKRGVNLSEDELYAIRGFIYSDVISPGFVKELIQEYGDESISATFLIPDNIDKYYLEYLFRRYKGDFYRNRYPSISFIDT
jgi:hypothetical protein